MSKDYPIKDIAIINRMREYYKSKNKNRDLLFFLLSINTGLKVNDILALNIGDVRDRDYIIVEHCADKIVKTIPLNEELRELIKLISKNRSDASPLFVSAQGIRMERTSVYRNFKEVCNALNLDDISISSLRKTFGYHYYQRFKDLSFLQWLFNQSTVVETMRYIDVTENLSQRYNMEFCL